MDSTVPAVSAAGNVTVAAYVYRPLTTKHRRAGSTGTTGDEEYTTDEEELYPEETECPGGTAHPILKSDLARAATDLFGYETKEQAAGDEEYEDDEPTGLFDEDETKFPLNEIANSSAKLSAVATGSKVHVVQNLARPKPTNPFYASSQWNAEDANAEENEARPEFHMCKRPTDLKLVSCTSEIETSSSAADVDGATQEYASSLDSSNPFSSSVHEDETDFASREQGLTVKRQFPHTLITAEAEELVKSEVESCARMKLEPYRSTSVLSGGGRPTSPTLIQWGRAVAEVKENAIAKLQDELKRAHEELKLKAEEVTRLSRIRQDVETEVEDLTASLFQEAHNMVREANVRQATAERLLAESRMKSEVLAAEVAALKTLVLTSTPARPNPHLHPQIDGRGRDETPGGLFTKRHRRSPSHFNLKYGRENSPPESPVKEQRPSLPAEPSSEPREGATRDGLEVDPVVHKEFLQWKANPCVDRADPFIKRIFSEDIDLCLDFANKELGGKVRQAVLDGIVFVEAVSDKSKVAFPKKCALLEAPRQCHYRMRLGDQENHWHSISQICRNRIIAVCDFLNYLRYIERGLVKSSVHDIYWEITRLRKEMVLARLGLALSS